MSHRRVPHLSVTNRGLPSVFTGSGDRAASTVSVVPGVRAPLLAEHGAGLGVAPVPGQASWKVGRWPPQLQQAFRRLSVSRRLFCGHMGAEGPEPEEPWAPEGSIHDGETEAPSRPRGASTEASGAGSQGRARTRGGPPGSLVPSANPAGHGLRSPRPPTGTCAGSPTRDNFLFF